MTERRDRNEDTTETNGEAGEGTSSTAPANLDSFLQDTIAIRQLATEALGIPHFNLNHVVDVIFMILRKTIRDIGYDAVPFTNVQTIFGPWRKGKFFISSGSFRSPATLFRTGDFTAKTLSENFYLISGCLGLRVLEVKFDKYELTFLGIGARGHADFSVGASSINIQVEADLREDDFQFRVVAVHLLKMSNISAAITGLWPITCVISKLIPLFIYIFWSSIAKSIEVSAKNAINDALVKIGLQERDEQQADVELPKQEQGQEVLIEIVEEQEGENQKAEEEEQQEVLHIREEEWKNDPSA